mmetsp:Transcript_1044/g.1821  ORF Transcript_1044/g.1821 Transcript_1044/m.1821 type:complete len:107 (-) Transcript_1044:177-497(-)
MILLAIVHIVLLLYGSMPSLCFVSVVRATPLNNFMIFTHTSTRIFWNHLVVDSISFLQSSLVQLHLGTRNDTRSVQGEWWRSAKESEHRSDTKLEGNQTIRAWRRQ